MTQTQSAAVTKCEEEMATLPTHDQTDDSATPRVQMTMVERNPTSDLRSCSCESPCSSTETNSTAAGPTTCKLYSKLPLSQHIRDAGRPKQTAFSIRLIKLKPGVGGDDLECDLFYVPSLKSVRFVALSYCWGDKSDITRISVNGRMVRITKSLYKALFHLRHASVEIILWADAICIDQGNESEKSWQVEHMPQIYTAAAEVIAWIGEGASGSEQAMDYINRYVGATSEAPCQHQDATPHTQLKSLYSREYWNRVWVIQEIAAAHRVNGKCVIRCGHKSVAFADFQSFLTRFFAEQIYTKDDSIMRPKHLVALSTAYEGKSFLQILFDSASFQSTDPRDRIYGIRGILPEFYRNRIKVDYRIGFQKLCQTVISTYIKHEKNLGILCQFKRFSPNDRYPSWVRDLRCVIGGISPSIYSASAGSEPRAFTDDTTLHTDGRCIGRPGRLKGPVDFPLQPTLGQSWPETSNLWKIRTFITRALRKRYPGITPEALESRSMNIVSGDRWRGATAEDTRVPLDAREIWNFISHLDTSSVVDEKVLLMYKHFNVIFSSLINRTLFTTIGGSIGVGPPDMKYGDMICVLHGCSYCVVLRKVKIRHYTFVGPAYVEGAMSGEYIRQAFDDEGNRMADERFHIR
ncbi:hypothetical protein PFICI_08752 [Pestalotiopsis fici W106-1]|uniref:Heterokaryon incompatibility domain-containing protein n=1 Tax=Pestalotiopsis fici (strain W106-1 / CGMCC3.15140) TaxID=1229662 RepID=W3WYP2_PESFW|nr:uncharacterized protein PFICI_08752 [Pestalotiopsis fici W106-1]ETS78899.1 hypothetical protein PFICI_08752 [Pestalotiopsis fici W106-1]